ncbi:MAG: galactokinase, partial [Clostridia bacterium]|nr:galactokinase [Clostridia bacterium]
MKGSNPLTEKLQQGAYDVALAKLYGQADVDAQRQRYIAAAENFLRIFGEGDGECRLFSAPGRTEICGNHTDHNHGRVVAGSVNLDAVAVVRPLSGVIRLQSEGYPMLTIDLSRPEPVEAEKNTSAALIRGTAARFRQLGYAVDGFEAYVTSNVLKGSGLSSSAAFEVLLGTVI